MFDDPNRNLHRLQEQLLGTPDRNDSDDPDAALAEVKQILVKDDWEEKQREPLYRRYIPYAGDLEQTEEPEELPQSEEKGKKAIGLWAILLVELALLAGVVIWWLIWK